MMKLTPLRYLLRIDAAVLIVLGGVLIFAPAQVERTFHFTRLPPAVSYIIGLWGCVSVTMGFGYWVAASNPVKHVIWVQVGIARGILECLLGTGYVVSGTVTFQQARTGIILAGVMALGYLVLYPRRPKKTLHHEC
jgi:hypothetical protein